MDTSFTIKRSEAATWWLGEHGYLQVISKIVLTPTTESVTVRFETTQPCSPFAEVLRDDPDPAKQVRIDSRFSLLSKIFVHNFDLGGEVHPLTQDTRHLVRITAPASAYPSLNPTPFIPTVKVRTLARSAFVTFAQIEMFQPGDPSGVGEDSFAFAVYDRDAAKQLGSVEYPGGNKTVSISAGSKPLIHKQIDVPVAPKHLRLWASGHDFDGFPFYGRLNVPIDAPAAMPAGPDSGLNASGEWATGTRDTDLPTIWGQFVIP